MYMSSKIINKVGTAYILDLLTKAYKLCFHIIGEVG